MESQNILSLSDTKVSQRIKNQEKSVSAVMRSGDTIAVPSLSVNVALPKITVGGRSSSVVDITPKKISFNQNTNYDPSPLKYSGININSNYSSM